MKAEGDLRQYEVTGRRIPSETHPKPPLYKMKIFAPNPVLAKSRFWYFLSKLKKMKKANGEVVGITEISEKRPGTIKNYGIWLRYDSRSGTHNMYREYRELSAAAAVTACYRDMASRHRTRSRSLQIRDVQVVPASKTRRPHTGAMHDSKIKFPLMHKPKSLKHRPTFVSRRPSLHF